MTASAHTPARARGQIRSVNIGEVREVEHNGRTVTTSIFKTPTDEPQLIAGVHVGSDQQADTAVHGGPDKAVYAYSAEDYAWWSAQLERPLNPGLFGENLLTSDIDVSGSKIGDRWNIGDVVLEVSEPRVPCFKLSLAVGEPRFQQRFAAADRPGAYLRIITEGYVQVGDAIAVEPATGPSISVAAINAIHDREPERANELVDIAALSDPWRAWARTTSEAQR